GGIARARLAGAVAVGPPGGGRTVARAQRETVARGYAGPKGRGPRPHGGRRVGPQDARRALLQGAQGVDRAGVLYLEDRPSSRSAKPGVAGPSRVRSRGSGRRGARPCSPTR